MKEIKRFHVYFVNKEEKAKLEKFMFGAEAYSDQVNTAKLNPTLLVNLQLGLQNKLESMFLLKHKSFVLNVKKLDLMNH